MITRTALIGQRVDWRKSLKEAITDPMELLTQLELGHLAETLLPLTEKTFPFRVPHSYAARIEKGNPNDPILLQVLPVKAENITVSGFENDALQEANKNPLPGLLHKYQGRVLLMLSGSCAVHCRFCFRREFPYTENNPGKNGLTAIFDYINNDPRITEVILSGGDPLVLPDNYLQDILYQLTKIPHVTTVRFHTRIPVVLPERITPEFLTWFAKVPLQKVIVIHSNHAQELSEETDAVFAALKNTNTTLLNQSVLLKGINDSVVALSALSRRLFAGGVLPYYLNLPDKVQGTAHFDVNEEQAKLLHTELQSVLPGYLVPRLVREVPGAPTKVWQM